MEDTKLETEEHSVTEYFDQSVFNAIVEAQNGRQREEFNLDFKLFIERISFLLNDEGDQDAEKKPAQEAKQGIAKCADITCELVNTNEEETDILTTLEDLIEDLLFRFETLHHVRRNPNEDDQEDAEDEEYNEEFAQQEISSVFEDCSKFKSTTTRKIINCSSSLSKLKGEIAELISTNPRARRQSKSFGMLSKIAADKNMGLLKASQRKPSFATNEKPIPEEEVTTNKEYGPIIESIHKFIKDQDLPDDEALLISTKINILARTLDHFKAEFKTANQKATDDQIKINNLQSRIPKIEESRERLSLKCEVLNEEIFEKKKEIAKLLLKIESLEKAAEHQIDNPSDQGKQEVKQDHAKLKQAVIPKSVLKSVLKASDEELEQKLAEIASSNEAIKVVLVRKNKQIRQLEGIIIQRNSQIHGLTKQVQELSAVSENVDTEADVKCERAKSDKLRTPEPEVQQVATPTDVELQSPSPDSLLSSALSEETVPDMVSDNFVSICSLKVFTSCAVNTDLELEEASTQTEVKLTEPPITDILENITFKIGKKSAGRKGSRKASVLSCKPGRRRSTLVAGTDSRRRSSMAPSDLLGVGSPQHHPNPRDLATIDELKKVSAINKKSRDADDILILQKYIASMREETERSMEKIREFITKEKSRNDATTRRLINEHEKILSQHKKEMNKMAYSVFRFKDMLTEILNGRDITQITLQTNFKFEQSPLQLRVLSSETLSNMEFMVYQALKEKDMKIRDLSGRRRLDDKDIDRRIKEREKTVFSILDYTNEKLRKEQERVTMREQWVNKRIRTEFEFEKQQDQEARSVEIALQRFWRNHKGSLNIAEDVEINEGASKPTSPVPRLKQNSQPEMDQIPDSISTLSKREAENKEIFSLEALIPKLYISVPDQRKNVDHLDVAHRAGALTNLGHKLITNIIARWLQLTEEKIRVLFVYYIKYRRWTDIMNNLLQNNNESVDEFPMSMDRAMLLHRRARDVLDIRYKRLHVDLGKLNSYRANMLEEEETFFSGVPDHRALKNIVRPNMLHINNNYGMLKRLMENSAPGKRQVHVMFPHVSYDQHSCSTEVSLENLPVVKHIKNTKENVTKWKTDLTRTTHKETEVKSLLVPKIMELDTHRTVPVRLQNTPFTQVPSVRRYESGLPPIPLYSGKMKCDRISYIPNIASMWSSKERT